MPRAPCGLAHLIAVGSTAGEGATGEEATGEGVVVRCTDHCPCSFR